MEKKSSSMTAVSLRRSLKAKKPRFLRQDGHKKVRLGKKWRKPKGLQNKMRLHKRGYRRSVSAGYKSPRKSRGLDRSGLKIVYVHSAGDLKNITPEHGIVISAGVGIKKRLEIIKQATSMKITIINIKDTAAYVKDAEERIRKKKEEKEKLRKDKKKKEEKQKKEAEEKEKKEKEKEEKEAREKKSIDRIAEEEEKKTETKKETEKKEKDRILTKKV